MSLLDVAAPDSRSETVNRVVGLRGNLVDVAERNRRKDGPENFLLHHFHGLGGVDEDCRLDEVTSVSFAAAARHRLGAFFFAGFQVAADFVELLFGNERTHVDFRIKPFADADFAGDLRHAVDDLVEDFLVNEKTRARTAGLALVEEDRAGRARDSGVDVGVFQNDVWRFAAKFERDLLQVARRSVHDQLADFGRSGEGDFIDIRMRRQSCAGCFAEPWDDVDYAFGESCFHYQLAETKSCERSLCRRLEYDGASRGQGGSELPGRH